MPVPTQVGLDVALLVEFDEGVVVEHEGVAVPEDGPNHDPNHDPNLDPNLDLLERELDHDHRYRHRYRFPGGAVEPGEAADEAAVRHLRRLGAAGDQIGPVVFAGCVEHGDRTGPGAHFLTVLYAVEVDRRDPARTIGRWEEHGDENARLMVVRLDEVLISPGALGDLALAWWIERWPAWRGLPVPDAEPWWSALRQSVRTLRAQLSARREVLRGSAFRDAAVAMCALVAVSDGTVLPSERDAMLVAITSEDVLSQYSPLELERLFDLHVARLRTDLSTGRRIALREIAKVRGDTARSWAVLRIGAVIGRADGEFVPVERQVVQDAAEVLGLGRGALAVQAVDQ